MEIKQRIEEALKQFEFKEREDKDKSKVIITVFKESAPEALKDSVREAHGERMPDDWIYRKYYYILDALNGYTIEKADGLDDNRAEIVDGLVDVYTHDLTAWLNSNINNVYYITEAQEEYGAQEDGFKILAMAQYKAIDEIYGEVASYLTK